MNYIVDLLKLLSGFIITTVSKWALAVVGAYLIEWGVSNPEDVIYKIVGGIVSLGLAALIGLLDHKKALNAEPPVK